MQVRILQKMASAKWNILKSNVGVRKRLRFEIMGQEKLQRD